MPSVVWQLCVSSEAAIDHCQRVGVCGVRSCVIGHRSELGHVLVFCQRNWWPRWDLDFVLLTGNWVDPNHLFQTNTVTAEPEGSTANAIARHLIRFRAGSSYLRLSESVFYRSMIMLGLLHFSDFPPGYSGGSPPKFWKHLFPLPFELHAWRIVVWPSSLSWPYC